MVSVRNTTLRERRQVRASFRAIFGAFFDRLQPHSPNQGASRINQPPVLAELATRGWVGSEHTSVRCNHTSVWSRLFEQEVHGRQREAGRVERLEVVGGRLLVGPPACGSAHQCADDDLMVGIICKQEKPGMQSDLQNWLVLRRIQNAGWGCATEAANPRNRSQELDLSSRHLTDCLIDALFGRADLDRMRIENGKTAWR